MRKIPQLLLRKMAQVVPVDFRTLAVGQTKVPKFSRRVTPCRSSPLQIIGEIPKRICRLRLIVILRLIVNHFP